MVDGGFHFAEPLWLWGMVLAFMVIVWLWYSSPVRRHGLEEKYADAEMLPWLSGEARIRAVSSQRPLAGWILAWSLLCIAMAGPRWGYRQINPFEPGADLVILLDISRSMQAADIKPFRLERARQEIQDLVSDKKGLRVGMVAFATIAHVVTPITEDGDSLLRQLPAISSELIRLQGSRPGFALERAESLLAGQGDDIAHNILLISDGDFGDASLLDQVRELHNKGIRVHVLAMGTTEGAAVPGIMAAGRVPVISRVDEDVLRTLADTGGGIFRNAGYRSDDTGDIVDAILSHAKARQNERAQTLVWNEYFYWPVLLAMLILLFLLRPGGGWTHFRWAGGG
jgi:Ca-activated chloride channel family protein